MLLLSKLAGIESLLTTLLLSAGLALSGLTTELLAELALSRLALLTLLALLPLLAALPLLTLLALLALLTLLALLILLILHSALQ